MRNFKFLILAVVFTQCSYLKISSDLDRTVNLYQYRNFNFSKEIDEINLSELNQQRLKDAISAQLHSKGYLVSYNPDLRVNAFIKGNAKTTSKDSADQNNIPFDYYRWGYSNIVNKYPEGTLFIDLIDVQTRKLVWQGIAEGFIKTKTSLTGKSINKVVSEIFDHFPY